MSRFEAISPYCTNILVEFIFSFSYFGTFYKYVCDGIGVNKHRKLIKLINLDMLFLKIKIKIFKRVMFIKS